MEDNKMNQDIFAGQWKQMRGSLKPWWGKLADDDFDRIKGQLGLGIGVVAIGGISLMLMLVKVLAAFTEIPLWGCYGIVGGAWSSWVGCCSLWANARPRPSTWCLSERLRP